MKLFKVEYLGYATADHRLSNPMIPWILSEIRKGSTVQKVSLGVHNGCLVCYADGARTTNAPFMSHPLRLLSRHVVINGNVTSFAYFLRDLKESILYCYLYQTHDPDDVVELEAAMRDQANHKPTNPLVRTLSNAATLTSLCADISPSSSHFFEVFYIGKIKVGQKKVSDTFLDDTLDKFWNSETQQVKKNGVSVTKEEDFTSNCQDVLVKPQPLTDLSSASNLAPVTPTAANPPSTLEAAEPIKHNVIIKAQEGGLRPRSNSMSSANSYLRKNDNNNSKVEDNRTMVFLVGHMDLRLISPDRKQILLHKQLRDIVCCVQGTKHNAHFGFICKEPGVEYNIGYIFKCQSDSVADELVTAISQANSSVREALKKEKQPVLSCDHCPMVWYHKLCADIENQSNEKRVQSCIFRRLELLPEEEQEVVLTKLKGAEALSHVSIKDQNQLLMMLLRAHCESKQSRHVHDSAENRHEFLNHYLGSSTIFMKAKRSLTSSFDQLLKRKGSRDDLGIPDTTKPITKELSLPMNAALCREGSGGSSPTSSSHLEVPETPTRPRSSTISSLPDSTEHATPSGSQMMNIFLKVGSTPKEESEHSKQESGSWRQAIFKTVVTPGKPIIADDTSLKRLSRRDKADLRALWRKAINQQVLLIRMEKENARLKASQEEATVKRIKLEYDDLGALGRKNIEVWEMIINQESRKADEKILLQAIRQGVPRSKRGEIWVYLAERYCAQIPPFDSSEFPNYNVPYEDLLKQLTSQQHAILIDLGRTFPNHTYFSSPLGPGQLALYNLLKAYSLLDSQVGYCQGLSFVAGVLLLHMTEDQAFFMLRHLMFRRQLRAQYLPDMEALQVQLYQLSRLLHDTAPELYIHLDHHEVAPTLFAAPWLLTVFASQFPLGFVTRVFDLVFLEGKEVLFRIALALLNHHRDGLLACDSFELIMDYLKTAVPQVDKPVMDKILKEVFISDISKKLLEYEVEYHVLQEEANTPRPELRRLKQLEEANKQLVTQNRCLSEQLEIVTSNIHRLETSRSSHMMQLNRMESQVRSLEVTISTLGEFISDLAYKNSDLEIPGEILRIIAQLNVSERKNLPNNVVRGLATRSENDRKIDTNKKAPPPFKSTVSSPNLQLKSNFISHNNKNQHWKLEIPTQENSCDSEMSSAPMKHSLSDSTNVKSVINSEEGKELRNCVRFKSSQPLAGRILTDQDKKALGLFKEDSDSFSKSNSMPASDGKKKLLKASQSSYELGKSISACTMSDLPLNSDTVNICFGGTTKLRTIRPLKTRQESCGSIQSQSSSTSSLFETCSTPKGKIELQIIEPSDEVCNSVFENNNDDFLFSKKSPPRDFATEKGRGK